MHPQCSEPLNHTFLPVTMELEFVTPMPSRKRVFIDVEDALACDDTEFVTVPKKNKLNTVINPTYWCVQVFTVKFEPSAYTFSKKQKKITLKEVWCVETPSEDTRNHIFSAAKTYNICSKRSSSDVKNIVDINTLGEEMDLCQTDPDCCAALLCSRVWDHVVPLFLYE